MKGSQQETAREIRGPWVHIQFDVDVDDDTEPIEIPFVLGVMGPYYGMRKDVPDLNKREFFEIDRHNFNDFLSKIMKPTLSFSVDNNITVQLTKDVVDSLKNDKKIKEPIAKLLKPYVGITYISKEDLKNDLKSNSHISDKDIEAVINGIKTKLPINLKFSSIEDFDPTNIVKQVPELNKLFTIRKNLSELKLQSSNNDDLKKHLKLITTKSSSMRKAILSRLHGSNSEFYQLTDSIIKNIEDEYNQITEDEKTVINSIKNERFNSLDILLEKLNCNNINKNLIKIIMKQFNKNDIQISESMLNDLKKEIKNYDSIKTKEPFLNSLIGQKYKSSDELINILKEEKINEKVINFFEQKLCKQ